jgi:hypothetical protein
MEDYTDFTNFLAYVKANEIFDIKLELAAMIILLNGNHQKINDAIAFAKSNSDFDIETHKASQSNLSLITTEDDFLYEKGELLNNFSQERLDEVFRLYHLMCKEKDIFDKPNDAKTKEFKSSNNTKKVLVATGIVVTAYLLYEILK